MHLKSVTLKGFKSFAQPTTFALEPGVTCIVGPNGSGKSNVVDALAWVMGEQGAKTLRGGKMEDVIFAGTSTRGPLGRAEVQLTIDNADGALPIDYSEVTISRTLFRNGASEYAINGETCRLLDVQELLSDSGLGREMHVIVGQGRLDAVLQASPEDRRGFIEEAAGILKHRRRKEKTLRKLDAMEANLTRLSDLAGELRRQLKPLGKQAEIAREAATIAAVVRDAKARLYADELARLRAELSAHARTEQERHAERIVLQDRADQVRHRIDELENDQRAEAVDRARAVAFELERVQERLRGLYSLAGQRLALLDDGDEPAAVTTAVTQAVIDEARAEIDDIGSGLGAAQDAAAAAAREVIRSRAELDALDADIAAQSALVSEHDMRLAALRGAAEAATSKADALRAAVDRQQRALDAAVARRTDAEAALAAVAPIEDGPGESSAQHAAEYERAQRDATDAEGEVGSIRERLHAAERERESLLAETAALGRALDIRNAAAALVERGADGVRGIVGDSIRVSPGYEAAIAAALGGLAEGVLVDDLAAAESVVDAVRGDDLGVIDIALVEGRVASPSSAYAGTVAALDVVAGPDGIRSILAAVAVADDLTSAHAAAREASEHGMGLTVVTRRGEHVTATTIRAGSGQARSRLELAAERDAAASRLSEVTVVADSLREALADAQAAWDAARQRTRDTLAALREHDSALAAHAEQHNRATVRLEAVTAECERLDASLRQAESAAGDADGAARTAASALAAAEASPRPILDASAREGLLDALETARTAEMGSRLDVETLRERVRAAEARVEQLERQRERERAAAEQAARRAVVRRAQRAVAADVASALPPLLDSVDRSMAQARVELERAEQVRTALTAELAELRQQDATVRERLGRLTESVHGIELQMHEKRLHVTSLIDRVGSELSLSEDILLAEYGPDVEERDGGATPGFDRPAQRRRLQDAERKLAQLGRVNPLALEEFAALEQRHAFLTEQLDDLVQTRKDLLTIIEELDERMQTIFVAAFEDTRQAFGEVFPILFPGGTGSISLTDPDNPLTTGIEVSVRPVGKKIERLSLLSGGERSLAAVALLTAIFKARPSPFYILDEVEAALDDANLGRLLGVFEQLRESSQLIVITHQKRTMEIADALYGVSMRQDGVSAVVGQRVRETAAV